MTRALKVHDGSHWVTIPEASGKVRVFDGHAWQPMAIVREYDGSRWVTTWELGGGPVTPPATHTITIKGTRSGGHWLFNTAKYRGRIAHATLTLHARSIWSGSAIGYPSGGTLASGIHLQGGHSTSRTVSAAAFNGATRGVTLHHTLGTTGAIDRVSLRITYHD